MCNRRVFRLVYLPAACPALPDPCPIPAPIRSDSGLRYPVPNEERSIHLNVCHLLRCRRNVCLFAAPSSPSPSLSPSPSSSSLLCLCLSLCYCFYLGKKRHRHRRHPSTRCPRSRPRPRSINAVVYLLDISETRPVQLSSALTSSNCPKFLGKRKQ